jgi:hypothetical protein
MPVLAPFFPRHGAEPPYPQKIFGFFGGDKKDNGQILSKT